MLNVLRVAWHGFAARHHLHELTYLTSPRQLRADLGKRLAVLSRRAVREGWTTRTTAALAASVWISQLTLHLEPERRMRLGRAIVAQEKRGIGPLDWLHAFESDRMNVVGEDVFMLRFNVGSGMLASWIAEGRAIDRRARRIFLSMAAWGLAGLDPSEVEERFEELLDDLGERD